MHDVQVQYNLFLISTAYIFALHLYFTNGGEQHLLLEAHIEFRGTGQGKITLNHQELIPQEDYKANASRGNCKS